MRQIIPAVHGLTNLIFYVTTVQIFNWKIRIRRNDTDMIPHAAVMDTVPFCQNLSKYLHNLTFTLKEVAN